ncbi:TetR/AcrR family transcriptional regulator [Streptomyces sp. VNUA24]|uniref:TetR/AcrR family transcriptional regulator n=1 Tax=Streptomyces sp. VNUA24 TaxID=3031131 RepID=UPI0023B7D5E6|nr:TetR/AcrR family transcriptional regulator [Streptomyces sp. VNUA24]WEH13092.1 TetR/AcrR family transcriptional regulator [Streptomyces sp. VNUA24]
MTTRAETVRASYHHGGLPAALRAAAIEIVQESGVAGFSLSKAARRVGVSSGAPYQHYRDGEALLADVAVEGYREIGGEMRRITDLDPAEWLGGLAAVQTRFAREHPAVFAVMCHCGLGPATDPVLAAEVERTVDLVREVARQAAGADGAHELALACVAVAQGFARLSSDACLAAGATPSEMADRAREVVTLLARNAAVRSPVRHSDGLPTAGK